VITFCKGTPEDVALVQQPRTTGRLEARLTQDQVQFPPKPTDFLAKEREREPFMYWEAFHAQLIPRKMIHVVTAGRT
jgi:hypothetical protein